LTNHRLGTGINVGGGKRVRYRDALNHCMKIYLRRDLFEKSPAAVLSEGSCSERMEVNSLVLQQLVEGDYARFVFTTLAKWFALLGFTAEQIREMKVGDLFLVEGGDYVPLVQKADLCKSSGVKVWQID